MSTHDWPHIWRQCVDKLVALMVNDQDGITILRATQLRAHNGKLQLIALNGIAKKQIEKNLAVIQFALKNTLPIAEQTLANKISVVVEEASCLTPKTPPKQKRAKPLTAISMPTTNLTTSLPARPTIKPLPRRSASARARLISIRSSSTAAPALANRTSCTPSATP